MVKENSWVVVFSSLNPIDVHLIKSSLEQAFIESRLRGTGRSILAGEVPMDDARSELLVHAEDAEKAVLLVQKQLKSELPDWQCSACDEVNPGAFQHCWLCGVNRITVMDAAQRSAD